jgi:hypothetical protein
MLTFSALTHILSLIHRQKQFYKFGPRHCVNVSKSYVLYGVVIDPGRDVSYWVTLPAKPWERLFVELSSEGSL